MAVDEGEKMCHIAAGGEGWDWEFLDEPGAAWTIILIASVTSRWRLVVPLSYSEYSVSLLDS